MSVRIAVVACALAALASPPARGAFPPGGDAPGACAGAFWADVVGTGTVDVVWGRFAPERIYGLAEADTLIGSHTRASCLFGGSGSDQLFLGQGGGVALGEEGRDLIVGSPKSDALAGGDSSDAIFGGAGHDVLRGDAATDALDAGPGDDALVTDDGNPELVTCGEGEDIVYADRADVLFGCERWRLTGPPLRQRHLDRDVGRARTTFRANFVSPERAPRGRFRVMVASPECGGPHQLARSRALRRGQRTTLRLRPPGGRWCAGAYVGAIIRSAPCPTGLRCPTRPPAQPLAWLAFVVKR